MAQSKLISAFLFLVFILSQQIQSIEGRYLLEGKKSYESKTLQTQTKIYETETIIHGGVFHGDYKSNHTLQVIALELGIHKIKINLLFSLFLLLFMSFIVFFGIIYESFYIISTNFYFNIQYFQQ